MTRRSWLKDSPAAAVVLPIIGLAATVALWWGATIVFAIEPYLLPSPWDVVVKFSEQPGMLLTETGTSLLETIEGFLLAIVIGVPIALLIVRSVILERLVYPLLLMVNSIPKVAVAPLLVVWMGFGQWPKVVMVLLMCFFPIVISTAQGMKSTPSELVELMRSLNASRTQEFFKLRLRYAMPQIFTGFKVAISLAVIGSVIAEFVGATKGLGYIIQQSGASADTTLAFAAITLLSVMSIVLFYGLALLEYLLLPWARETR
ncbi:ABC transporter permease [Kribbella solani]|uniref:NitT/TauT family transport system permease protein n=1 Tax=Kribbella solani TaxID=236067 RepID=A0A841DI36_9ACTN|nr:ABC transporter permease [Kribbella solani]MBB5978804.1 NitT/TauT family transport system permease protein [Kribbella solani]MDX2971810.1 ABC transporter permease [Kribbella solani]MDX3000476.1 ABC transporter permease [Kribbella solani]